MQAEDRGVADGPRARQHRRGGGSAEEFAAEALPQLRHLYPAAMVMAGREPAAQELVIEAYARAYASNGQRGDASIAAWLYRHLASAAEDGAGTAGPAAGERGTELPERPRTDPGDGQVPDLDQVPGDAVKEALQRVPARRRLAIYLAEVEGFSASGIARILQVPATRVKARKRRGRRQLRAALEGRS